MRRITLATLAIATLARCEKINLFATGGTQTESLTIWADDSTIAVGGQTQVHSSKGPGIHWRSTNSRVASISTGGVVRGHSLGQVSVSGEWSNGAVGGERRFTARMFITVIP